ncbi:MAG TPA: VWA domain-containing protein [Vicinamibacterales bacterium]|nr:VWA domain-containing protein [Vicinamibacterales bacterium]
MKFTLRPALLFIVSLAVVGPALLVAAAQQDPKPTFTATVARVPISAVVTDSKNRRVQTLTREEFEVLENGTPRAIVDFSVNERAPIALALLFDTSGSMAVGSSLADAKSIVRHVLGWVDPQTDEVALFTFSRGLREEVPFTSDTDKIGRALSHVEPLGSTSLYDAINEVASVLGNRPARRQAVVVVTDGIDTSSAMTASEVSAAAASIDVPVYILAAVASLTRPAESDPIPPITLPAGTLADLASWTGGTTTLVSAPAHASIAARQLVSDLRHQYVLAIAAATEPGWYSLRVNARHGKLNVRSRTGYLARPGTHIGTGGRPAR